MRRRSDATRLWHIFHRDNALAINQTKKAYLDKLSLKMLKMFRKFPIVMPMLETLRVPWELQRACLYYSMPNCMRSRFRKSCITKTMHNEVSFSKR